MKGEMRRSREGVAYTPIQAPPVEERKTSSIGVKLTPTMKKELELLAKAKNTTVSPLVEELISKEIEKHRDAVEKARQILLDGI